MENGAITNDELSASSVFDSSTGASRGRLNLQATGGTSGGWVAKDNDDSPTLKITFSYRFTRVTGIATQGRQDESQWVKKYKLRYSKPYSADASVYTNPGETASKVNNNLMDFTIIVFVVYLHDHFFAALFPSFTVLYQTSLFAISARYFYNVCSSFSFSVS